MRGEGLASETWSARLTEILLRRQNFLSPVGHSARGDCNDHLSDLGVGGGNYKFGAKINTAGAPEEREAKAPTGEGAPTMQKSSRKPSAKTGQDWEYHGQLASL